MTFCRYSWPMAKWIHFYWPLDQEPPLIASRCALSGQLHEYCPSCLYEFLLFILLFKNLQSTAFTLKKQRLKMTVAKQSISIELMVDKHYNGLHSGGFPIFICLRSIIRCFGVAEPMFLIEHVDPIGQFWDQRYCIKEKEIQKCFRDNRRDHISGGLVRFLWF